LATLACEQPVKGRRPIFAGKIHFVQSRIEIAG
jgi:hypothetical protein